MARKRMIDPSFWTDEKLGECTKDERLLFMGLVSHADDEGYGRANPKLLRSLIFPYDDLRISDLEKWLSHLGGLELIALYTVDGQSYYYLPNFLKHQTINKPTPSNLPKPTEALPEDYGSATVVLPPKRKEENRKEYIGDSAEPPESDYEILFEKVWLRYPNKKGKNRVSTKSKKNLVKIGEEHITRCIERYMADLKKDDWRKPQYGSTFFNGGYVDYLDANYEPCIRDTEEMEVKYLD